MTSRHLTPGEQRTRAAAAAAVDRAMTHIRPPQPDNEELGRLYRYVTHARAREIRLEIEEDRRAHR